ncbi:MAG: hypothetical protein ACOH2E_08730 [Candidatus Paracaedibacter sp.]
MTANLMQITFEGVRALADSILTKEEKNCKPPSVFFKEASDFLDQICRDDSDDQQAKT